MTIVRIRSLSALAVSALLALTGCGSGGGSASGDPVRLLVFGAPEELGAYRTLAEAYQQARTGERIQLIEASDRKDLLARLATSVAAAHRRTCS